MARRRSSARAGRPPAFLESRGFLAGMIAFIGVMLVLSVTQGTASSSVRPLVLLSGAGLLVLAPIVAWPRLPRLVVRWIRARRKPKPKTRAGVTSRAPIPAGLRFAVLHRDGFRCRYCGRGEPDGVPLHIDHLVPVVEGGRNEIDNLVTSCQDCNLGKSAKDVVGPNHR